MWTLLKRVGAELGGIHESIVVAMGKVEQLFDPIEETIARRRGHKKSYMSLESGVEVYVTVSKLNRAVKLKIRRNHRVFQRASFSDSLFSISHDPISEDWKKLVHFARANGIGELPRNYSFLEKLRRVYTSSDSEIFSISLDDLIAIDDAIQPYVK